MSSWELLVQDSSVTDSEKHISLNIIIRITQNEQDFIQKIQAEAVFSLEVTITVSATDINEYECV